MRPLVSICVPSLNPQPFLAERMETILAQTVPDWELIICDSYSDDGSWDFFQKFKGDPRMHMVQVPRAGLYAGWNECLRRATGEFVYIATADDTMTADCLEKLISPLARHPNIGMALCDYQDIDEQSRPMASDPSPYRKFLNEWMHTPSIRNGRTEFLLHCAFGTTVWVTVTALLIRRSMFEKTGYFRTDLGSKADEVWTLRASLATDMAYLPEKLATWRHHSRQATRSWTAREAEQVMCRCMESVLRDPDSGIPEAWRRVAGWDRELSAHYRWKYEHTFKLFRWMARQEPGRFLNDLWLAMRLTPAWFWHQTLRGFPALENEEFDAVRHARRLIDMFGADWPPKRLDQE